MKPLAFASVSVYNIGMKDLTVTVAGRVKAPIRAALEARAVVEGTTVSKLIARVLTQAARKWSKT